MDKNFPIGHCLRSIFNRFTLKISYSGLPNVKSKMQQHNHKVLQGKKPAPVPKTCSCRKRACPVGKQCLTEGVVYKATVNTPNDEKQYIGSSCDQFKKRYNNHISDINCGKKKTALSSYVIALKEAGTPYQIKWEFLYRQHPGNRSAGLLCAVCNLERFAIAMADKRKSLNKRSELTGKCPHQRLLYL